MLGWLLKSLLDTAPAGGAERGSGAKQTVVCGSPRSAPAAAGCQHVGPLPQRGTETPGRGSSRRRRRLCTLLRPPHPVTRSGPPPSQFWARPTLLGFPGGARRRCPVSPCPGRRAGLWERPGPRRGLHGGAAEEPSLWALRVLRPWSLATFQEEDPSLNCGPSRRSFSQKFANASQFPYPPPPTLRLGFQSPSQGRAWRCFPEPVQCVVFVYFSDWCANLRKEENDHPRRDLYREKS